jgi:hypothetical protein
MGTVLHFRTINQTQKGECSFFCFLDLAGDHPEPLRGHGAAGRSEGRARGAVRGGGGRSQGGRPGKHHPHTAMQQLRIITLGLSTRGRQKTVLG